MSTPLYTIQGLEFRGDRMLLTINGKQYMFPLSEISRRLAKASKMERERFEISPSGYGIHWPLIDEDLSLVGLLRTAAYLSNRREETDAIAV